MLQSVAFSSGTGKSHFVEALAHAAIDKDLRVAWFTLESLTTTITRAKIDGSVARTVTRICRCDLIVVDDIGMLPAGQDAAEAFYRRRCRLRAPLRSSDQQHPSVRIRLDHAQNPGHGNSGPAAASRPPHTDQRRLTPARRGPGRQRGGPIELNHQPGDQRPRTRIPDGRQPGDNTAVHPDFLVALDTGRTVPLTQKRFIYRHCCNDPLNPRGLTEDDPEDPESVLALIKSMPSNVSLESMLTEIRKLKAACGIGLPARLLSGAAPKVLGEFEWSALLTPADRQIPDIGRAGGGKPTRRCRVAGLWAGRISPGGRASARRVLQADCSGRPGKSTKMDA
jgi:IstB-like ATP binding protein